MTSDHGVEGDRERRLFEILASYFADVEAGRAPDRAEWLARHSDLAADIERFLGEQESVLRLTEPLRPSAGENVDFDFGSEGDSVNSQAGGLTGARLRYVGDYELLSEIARGGMGIVFRARQQSLNRSVALKMLVAGRLNRREDERRFRQEAESAANLDHPNIVPVYEVGMHEGHNYFSMKLFEGGNLGERLSDFRGHEKAAAMLVVKVARAVQHAHDRGVLHRDLKPSNILLGGTRETAAGELEPHVSDFGLAKRAEADPGLTESGAVVGTPSYMAPEQATGKKGVVTVATDVYGLGAVLYALLCGKPPFQGDSALETITQVRERAVERPSSQSRGIDRDLETICLTCLEKEPERRYGSSEAVAEDLERWLSGEPIVARPAGRVERGVRWCRRNPMAAAMAGTVVAFVAVSIGGLLFSNRVIGHERDWAKRHQKRAERLAGQARRAVDKMYTRFAEEWLANQARLEPMQQEFLLEALAFYEEFSREDAQDDGARLGVAIAQRRVGEMRSKLGDFARAESELRRSLEVVNAMADQKPRRLELGLELAESNLALGRLLIRTAKKPEGKEAFQKAALICRAMQGEDAAPTEICLALADALVHLDTEESLKEAIEALADLKVEGTQNEKRKRILGDAYAHYGSALFDRGQVNESLDNHQKALKIRMELAKEFPHSYITRRRQLISTTDLARDFAFLNRLEEAAANHRDALALATELAAQFPLIPDNHANVSVSAINLGSVLNALGRLDEAEGYLRRAVEVSRSLDGNFPRRYDMLCASLIQWGDWLAKKGSLPLARRAFEEVLDLDPSVRHANEARHALARVLAASPMSPAVDVSRALQLARKATELAPNDPDYWTTLGLARYRNRDWDGVIAACTKPTQLGARGADIDLFLMAMAQWQRGEKALATKTYTEATSHVPESGHIDPELWHFLREAAGLLGVAPGIPDGSTAVH